MRKRLLIAGLLTVTFFALNYTWTQVALAYLSGAMERCPAQALDLARNRVDDFVGGRASEPWLLCQKHPAFGLAPSHGTTRFAPFLPPAIVIGPHGRNVDVIAHEWMHAEIAVRTSALLRTYRIPTWFDEGLAMQLDRRPDYDEHALATFKKAGPSIDGLNQLSRPHEFFRPGDEGKSHYALARCVVGRWMASVRHGEAMKLLDNVSWQRAFPSRAFEPHERACLANRVP